MRLWLLVILILNVQPHGWEGQIFEFKDLKECQSIAKELNDKQNYLNEEANQLNKLQLEQVYAWCEKK